MATDNRRIQSTSFFGPITSSPAAADRSQLEDPDSELTEGDADAEELVLGGEGSRDRLTVDGQVGHGPRRREAECPGGDGLLHDGFIDAMSSGVAASLWAPRSPMT